MATRIAHLHFAICRLAAPSVDDVERFASDEACAIARRRRDADVIDADETLCRGLCLHVVEQSHRMPNKRAGQSHSGKTPIRG
jgi:hypothetical protein